MAPGIDSLPAIAFLAADTVASAADSIGDSRALPAFSLKFLGYAAGVLLFGALVGAAEIISRYRDEPWHALRYKFATIYMGLNAVTGLFVFVLLLHFSPTHEPVTLALLSGFGAMGILRSKFFTVRTAAGEDVPIGVDAAVTSFLRAADRSIDRWQADERWKHSFNRLHDTPDEKAFTYLTDLFGTNLASYQNVSPEEREDFGSAIEKLRAKTGVSVGLRAVAAGLAFQEIAGSENFDQLAKEFRAAVGLPPILLDGPRDSGRQG